MLFAGIDWASDHHDLMVLTPEGNTALKTRVSHSAEGFSALREQMDGLHVPPAEVAVAIEMHEGPLILWLLDQGYAVYGINPRTADRARDRLSASGAKDDSRDALSLADFLRGNAARLRALRPEAPSTAEMRQFVRLREDLVQERTVQKQRLVAYLQQYAPSYDDLLGPFRTVWSLAFLNQFPTLRRLQAAKPGVLRTFFRKQRLQEAAREAIQALRTSPALPVPEYLDAPHALEVQHRVMAIQSLNQTIEEIERKIAEVLPRHPDANVIDSLPCGGPATRGAIWSGLEADAPMCMNAEELASRWGAAPVTYQSGKMRGVRKRRACDHTQSQYLLWFSWATTQKKDCWASEYYSQKRAEGCRHYAALRCVARRWVRILWTLFSKKVLYEESAVRRNVHAASPA